MQTLYQHICPFSEWHEYFWQEVVEDFVPPPSFAVFPDFIFQMYFTQLPICCRAFPIPSTFTLRSGWPDYSCTHAHKKAKGALK